MGKPRNVVRRQAAMIAAARYGSPRRFHLAPGAGRARRFSRMRADRHPPSRRERPASALRRPIAASGSAVGSYRPSPRCAPVWRRPARR